MVGGEVLVEDVWTKWVFATCLPMANNKTTDALSSRPDPAWQDLSYNTGLEPSTRLPTTITVKDVFAPFTLLEISLDDPEGKTS